LLRVYHQDGVVRRDVYHTIVTNLRLVKLGLADGATRWHDYGMDKSLHEFFLSLDRSAFIDTPYKVYADLDRPLPIGHSQTISQPSLVYYMTEELELARTHRVLEVGTGSGYQTALLSAFSKEVYTIEFIEELAHQAKGRLTNLGYTNIYYKTGDASEGWAEYAPFDRIMITAAPKKMPKILLEQLAPKGIIILPVGPQGHQELRKILKTTDNEIIEKKLFDVSFVPMVGKYNK
jgi:protein-L-isoaspartate(D-aspartate) O-methyltransferase